MVHLVMTHFSRYYPMFLQIFSTAIGLMASTNGCTSHQRVAYTAIYNGSWICRGFHEHLNLRQSTMVPRVLNNQRSVVDTEHFRFTAFLI